MAVLSVERLKGMDLYDRENERVGNIVDVVVDPDDGGIRYVVASTGGALAALGIQDRLFAIPFEVLTIGADRAQVQAPRARLKDAPSFSPSQPPPFTREYERTLCEFWGLRPSWEQPGYRLRERRAGDLMDREAPTVRPDTPVEEVAHALARAGNLAVPVVDAQGRYLGLITAPQLTEQVVTGGRIPERRHKEAHLRPEEAEAVEEVLARDLLVGPEAREAAREWEEWEDKPTIGEPYVAHAPERTERPRPKEQRPTQGEEERPAA
ncbi:MAG: PRC-barrel domain-containing protein [Chloroflexi bacterium]|nr:PRC-barrel domain-containing protein [Chloroflexota bacterium]